MRKKSSPQFPTCFFIFSISNHTPILILNFLYPFISLVSIIYCVGSTSQAIKVGKGGGRGRWGCPDHQLPPSVPFVHASREANSRVYIFFPPAGRLDPPGGGVVMKGYVYFKVFGSFKPFGKGAIPPPCFMDGLVAVAVRQTLFTELHILLWALQVVSNWVNK